MSRRKKDPLRELTAEEHQELLRLSRSQAAPAVEVIRAKLLLAVADGDDYQDASRSVGRRSGDAVSHLVARFNAEGAAALTPRHGGGRRPTCGPEERARIAAEAARTPTPEADGTATWSLVSRLTFMMLDDDAVATSPASVSRVLNAAGRLDRRSFSPSKKGTGFVQPLSAHEHWHVDVSYINVEGTFSCLTSLLDGYSRTIMHWEIRESMTERDVETIVQRGLERYPEAKPRIISDNGPQFIARDFKEFIRVAGITHVRTRPYYPQSNGKLERWHGSLKRECVRPAAPASLEEARRRIASHVDHYNTVRLHSALGYVTPMDKLAGLDPVIFAARDRKLDEARAARCQERRAAREVA